MPQPIVELPKIDQLHCQISGERARHAPPRVTDEQPQQVPDDQRPDDTSQRVSQTAERIVQVELRKDGSLGANRKPIARTTHRLNEAIVPEFL